MANVTTRDIALDILLTIQKNGTFSNVALHEALDKNASLDRHDRAFITRLCEGTLERRIEIDYVLDHISTVPVAKMKPVIQNIMRMAAYQILFMGGIPDSAAVNEAVTQAQTRGFYNLKGFVNGVLRSLARGKGSVVYPDPKKNRIEYLSVTYSMPRWLVKFWVDEYGAFVTEEILKGLLAERPTTVRLTTDKTDKNEILRSLKGQGVKVKKAPYLPYAYHLSEYNHLPALTAFRNGWIYPQDVSSMLVAEIANVHAGDFVVDLCASPGGKSIHLADKMAGFGMIEARDLTEEKVALIDENIARLNLINIHAQQSDAREFDPEIEEKADLVICDLPCSGLGVIGRKTDIKYKVSLDQIEELVLLQRQILHNAASYVRPGGTLIYSTCTICPKENLGNARWFAENYPFRFDSLDPFLPKELRSLTTEEGHLQLFPGIHDTDGFFLSRFVKEKTGV